MQGEMRIKYGEIPNVLMLGNGLNRAYNFASWDDIIESMQTKVLTYEENKRIKKVPYPLQPVILTEDHVDVQLNQIAYDLTELSAPAEEETLIRRFIELPVDSIITTNYTYEIEKAGYPNFKCSVGHACKFRRVAYDSGDQETTRLLNTYFCRPTDNKSVWHLHGEAALPDTMILGHYYYGKLLAMMQNYVGPMISRYNKAMAKKQDFICRSWLDFFMAGNVYIVGQGMDLSEMDLWWLVNCKKKYFENTSVTLYKPDIKTEEKLLAEAYGVKIVQEKVYDKNYKPYYEKIYIDLVDEFRKK